MSLVLRAHTGPSMVGIAYASLDVFSDIPDKLPARSEKPVNLAQAADPLNGQENFCFTLLRLM